MMLERETMVLLLFHVIFNKAIWWMWAVPGIAVVVQAQRTSIELNSSLDPAGPDQPLYSGEDRPAFMLSFRSPSSSSASSTKLYLCISFVVNMSEAGQCVWTANRDTAVTASASLTLSSLGILKLSDPLASDSDIFHSNTSGLGVVRAQLLDSGNLVLVNSTGGYVWQSFHYPTDTLLPGQDFTPQSASLVCNKRAGDFSSGRYSLGFSASVQVLQLFKTAEAISYWSDWGQINSFRFDQLGNITLFNSPSSVNSTFVTSDHGSLMTRRMTLDMDGNLRMYAWDEALAQWNTVWMAFTDVCTRVLGLCGSYGVCAYNPMPTCMCPQGFSVVDTTDLYGGCSANYKIDNCSSSIKYVEVVNIDYPFNDYLSFLALSIEECKLHCSSYCECMVAVYWQSEEYGRCFLKRGAQNGYIPSSQQHRVFLKISAADPLVSDLVMITTTQWSSLHLWQLPSAIISSNHKEIDNHNVVIALAVVIAIQAVCFAGTVATFISRWKKQMRYMKLHGELEGSPLVCSYEELRIATQNFNQKLGAGGFGTVYKGQLQNGKLVAVKQLEGMSQQEKQFRAEIVTLGRIHHINLLRLVGFCSEGTHRLLVYEYMEKGSLDQVLFKDIVDPHIHILDWGTRFQICLDVARGIHYLHEECFDCILHCDIKPQNILLDGSFCAKVADFGLAYLYRRDHTVKMTTIRGTRGYLAPEWVSNLPITSKADVYSYGMLIMEIVSGRRNYLHTESSMMDMNERWCFPMWAYGKSVKDVADARLDMASIDWTQVETVVKVAFACIQADMNARPAMGKVVQMLEGTLPTPHAPPPSLFTQDQPYPVYSSLKSRTINSSSSSQAFSVTLSSEKKTFE